MLDHQTVCCAQCGAGVGFSDADVNEHVSVELRDGLDDSVVLAGLNPVEYRTMQAAPSSPPTPLPRTRFPPIIMIVSATRRHMIASTPTVFGAGIAVV